MNKSIITAAAFVFASLVSFPTLGFGETAPSDLRNGVHRTTNAKNTTMEQSINIFDLLGPGPAKPTKGSRKPNDKILWSKFQTMGNKACRETFPRTDVYALYHVGLKAWRCHFRLGSKPLSIRRVMGEIQS